MRQPYLIIIALLLALLSVGACAAEDSMSDTYTAVYFTGIGCSHCARVDPVMFLNWTQENPDFVIIEYELFSQKENGQVILEFDEKYHTGVGVPVLFFSSDTILIGDASILAKTPALLSGLAENRSLLQGETIDIDSTDIPSLPGRPKIWNRERVLIRTGPGGDNNTLRALLFSANLSEALQNVPYQKIPPTDVAHSGVQVPFRDAVQVDGWILQWNDDAVVPVYPTVTVTPTGDPNNTNCTPAPDLALPKILSLAVVDAINPCALAVLTFMLIAILTHNPTGKRDVLLAGLSFSLSVFICYFFYGILITTFFQVIQSLAGLRLLLYDGLGFAALILGAVHIFDFLNGQNGQILRIPLRLKPRLSGILSGIVSPAGAFLMGIFVTLFLLPCTIGPYIIGCGILSVMGIIDIIPYLLVYNAVFILPMIGITLVVYSGIGRIEDVAGWREKNVRYLHLVSGTIIILLGLGMLLGFI